MEVTAQEEVAMVVAEVIAREATTMVFHPITETAAVIAALDVDQEDPPVAAILATATVLAPRARAKEKVERQVAAAAGSAKEAAAAKEKVAAKEVVAPRPAGLALAKVRPGLGQRVAREVRAARAAAPLVPEAEVVVGEAVDPTSEEAAQAVRHLAPKEKDFGLRVHPGPRERDFGQRVRPGPKAAGQRVVREAAAADLATTVGLDDRGQATGA